MNNVKQVNATCLGIGLLNVSRVTVKASLRNVMIPQLRSVRGHGLTLISIMLVVRAPRAQRASRARNVRAVPNAVAMAQTKSP